MEKQIGVMKGVGFGCRDFRGGVGLWFTVYTSENVASLQCVFGEEAIEFIKKYEVYDVKNLEGKPVWVLNKNNISTIHSPCLI